MACYRRCKRLKSSNTAGDEPPPYKQNRKWADVQRKSVILLNMLSWAFSKDNTFILFLFRFSIDERGDPVSFFEEVGKIIRVYESDRVGDLGDVEG